MRISRRSVLRHLTVHSLPSRKDYFADGFTAFALCVNRPEIGRIDRRYGFGQGRAERSAFNQGGNFIQQKTLFSHVGRLEHRAGEHGFPTH